MSLNEIKNLVSQAEVKVSRSVGSTKLIAVSKVQPNSRIEAVLVQGHRLFGENRVQEAQSKWPNFKEKYDAVFASNVIHYIESRYVDKFFEGSKNTLKSNGLVVLYGPFKNKNEYSSVGDEQLDLLLKSENKSFGIRNLEELKNVACLHNFEFLESINLPANNKLVCWKKKSSNEMPNGVYR